MPETGPILILGGTRDARELAQLLQAEGLDAITSLAGRTADPLLPPGRVRMGGFGGAEGLAAYLREAGIALIADATHPFAAVISANAAAAASAVGIPCVRLTRPAWEPGPGERWLRVSCTGAASDAILPGARVLLTTGHKDLASFFARTDITGIARTIEAPAVPVPPRWQILNQRPPFTRDSELALMRRERITLLVTKNAGGPGREKLDAAAELGVPVLMIERPAKPELPSAPDAAGLIQLIKAKLAGE